MKKTIFSILIYSVSAVLVFCALFILVVNSWPRLSEWIELKRQERIIEKYDKALALLDQRRKEDTFGGKTPEETVEKFLAVLKVGDLEQASKYYEVAIQEKALVSLKEEKNKYGDLNLTINYFEEVLNKGEKKCQNIDKESGGCWYILETNKGTEEIDFGLNKFNYIWKITFPY